MKCLDMCDLILILIRFSCLNLYFRMSIFLKKSSSTLEISTCISSYSHSAFLQVLLDCMIRTWISDMIQACGYQQQQGWEDRHSLTMNSSLTLFLELNKYTEHLSFP